MTKNVKKHGKLPTPSRALAAIALIFYALMVTTTGCSSECSGEDCETCADSQCGNGQRCVQGDCRRQCMSDRDCVADQVCRNYQFQVGDVGQYCVVVAGELPAGRGRFTVCSADSECDTEHGFTCLDGECTYECQSHQDCVAVGHCDAKVVDGKRKQVCVRDASPPRAGELYTSCPRGDECGEPALCVGAGAGDLDAYCTIDCREDSDCALGYYCGSVTRAPCAAACDVEGAPNDPRCAPLSQIGAGKAYQCGDNGPQRRVCRQREFCSPCDSDADCLGVANQICAKDESGEKICTRLCDTGARSCPWGNAARCSNFDEDVGAPTCSHRFGSCHGSGAPCEPCRSNDDCPGGVCTSSQFTGERWCINLDLKCECKNGADRSGLCADGGCPDSPGGLTVTCIAAQNICYAANSATDTPLGTSPQTGCWGSQ